MDFFDLLTMIGGLCLFLFGMNIMGQALERRAGDSLKSILGKMTTRTAIGLLTGLGVTAVIQSSSATTVMVVGFVNSGLMTLRQAINVIMGANIGTTVTAWILSLGGIDGSNFFVRMLKPSSFTPILALIGIINIMFAKSGRKKDTGTILLGFATLMFGMETMSGAVKGLADVPAFQSLFVMFKNPILGVLAGALLTAVIQSSSASVGILQALAVTGQVSYGAAIPIIMGQNIGTCITAILSSIGANKNAKRAALVHLSFNVIGTIVWLTVYILINAFLRPAILDAAANSFGIAVAHSAFNILCTILLLPMAGMLEKLVTKLVPDSAKLEMSSELDERLLATPPIALERCRMLAVEMASCASGALGSSLSSLREFSPALAKSIRADENQTDHYEDILSSYLVQLSTLQISEKDSREAAGLLKMIGDFERIGDHAVNLLESAEELRDKGLAFSKQAEAELSVMYGAVSESLALAVAAFAGNDVDVAAKVEPLEQVVDNLKELLRMRHILRLQKGECSINTGFVLADVLTNLERVSDHCSNIAACVIDMAQSNMNMHETIRATRSGSAEYDKMYRDYASRFALPESV
ncbi:MAG: Na/Pi cotransporter family protein [Oscillospiraceae bacterium]|nr:Na/Pi cotransporter family protein [Oscillospiraceae bacterium]